MDPIELSIFSSRIEAVCEEMGGVLRRSAFSPNIKDRLDFSCAVFDADGALCAQAAHIPVHLGSMAYAMTRLADALDWRPGQMLIVNDPFLGGTHLPDITLIAPLFHAGQHIAFVANRAHHADIGCDSPGSMPLSTSIDQEGLVIPPSLLVSADGRTTELYREIIDQTRNPVAAEGDFSAQISANKTGIQRLGTLVGGLGLDLFSSTLQAMNDYAERLARTSLRGIPDGEYRFTDRMDDDGAGNENLPIAVRIQASDGRVKVDFQHSAAQTSGNINCPLSVTAAAVYYVFRCLMPEHTPACAGSLHPITLHAPEGTLVNARRPAAVAAGNVETSSRITDVLLGALAQALPERIPAASHGSMNNVALGSHGDGHDWDYYETIGGGMGAGPHGPGLDALQTHMTNTLNTPVEALEMGFPLRIRQYAIRRNSGGAGRHHGGNGLVREFEFLEDTEITLISERRISSPWGLAGGRPGRTGRNTLNGHPLPGKARATAGPGDRLRVATAGGGGWGRELDL